MKVLRVVFLLVAYGLWFGLVGRAGWVDWVQGAPVVLSAWLLFCRAADLPAQVPVGKSLPWLFKAIRFLTMHVAVDMLRSTARVFGKVVSPTLKVHPAIVKVTLPDATEADLILFAYSIALTPGQQIVDIQENSRTLYVHITDAPDPQAQKADILALYARYLGRT